ncbi:hypothetical protein HRbin12_01170 [bacterium HR12]|nr:hypothetical protein HRbin12_01170 [bacterium HR12]
MRNPGRSRETREEADRPFRQPHGRHERRPSLRGEHVERAKRLRVFAATEDEGRRRSQHARPDTLHGERRGRTTHRPRHGLPGGLHGEVGAGLVQGEDGASIRRHERRRRSRETVQHVSQGRRLTDRLPRLSERVQDLDLAGLPLVQLRVLHRRGDEHGEGVHEGEVVVIEAVRRLGVHRDDPDEPTLRGDDGDREVGLVPVVVEFGEPLEAGVLGGVLRDHPRLARERRPTRQPFAQGETEASEPPLVPLDPRPDHEPLALLIPEVDERAVAAGQLLAQADHVIEETRDVQRRGQARQDPEQGLGLAALVPEHLPEDPGSFGRRGHEAPSDPAMGRRSRHLRPPGGAER